MGILNDFAKRYAEDNLDPNKIGKHPDVPDDEFYEEQLKKGTEIELEHIDRSIFEDEEDALQAAENIAKDHLVENPIYYDLAKIDEEGGIEFLVQINPGDLQYSRHARMGIFRRKAARKPILWLDFDGVLHSYTSDWKGAAVIPDPPVEGAMQFLKDAQKEFEIEIFSTRNHQRGGIKAMKKWLKENLTEEFGEDEAKEILSKIRFPKSKPKSHVQLDDRALTFEGKFPTISELKAFKPWNRDKL